MFFLDCFAQGVCHIHFLRAWRAGLPPRLGCQGFEPWNAQRSIGMLKGALECSCLSWPCLGSLMMSKPDPA